MPNPVLIVWDWKDRPDFEEIKKAILLHGENCKVIELDTNCDDYCVAIGPSDMTEADAKNLYQGFSDVG